MNIIESMSCRILLYTVLVFVIYVSALLFIFTDGLHDGKAKKPLAIGFGVLVLIVIIIAAATFIARLSPNKSNKED